MLPFFGRDFIRTGRICLALCIDHAKLMFDGSISEASTQSLAMEREDSPFLKS